MILSLNVSDISTIPPGLGGGGASRRGVASRRGQKIFSRGGGVVGNFSVCIDYKKNILNNTNIITRYYYILYGRSLGGRGGGDV